MVRVIEAWGSWGAKNTTRSHVGVRLGVSTALDSFPGHTGLELCDQTTVNLLKLCVIMVVAVFIVLIFFRLGKELLLNTFVTCCIFLFIASPTLTHANSPGGQLDVAGLFPILLPGVRCQLSAEPCGGIPKPSPPSISYWE